MISAGPLLLPCLSSAFAALPFSPLAVHRNHCGLCCAVFHLALSWGNMFCRRESILKGWSSRGWKAGSGTKEGNAKEI